MESQTASLLIGLFVGLLLGMGGALSAYFILRFLGVKGARERAEELVAAGRQRLESERLEAEYRLKAETLERREQLERDMDQGRREIKEQEARIEKREDNLVERLEFISRKEREFESVQKFLAEQQEDLTRRQGEVKQLLSEQRDQLVRVSRLSLDEARNQLLARLEQELEREFGDRVLKHEQNLRENSQQKSREILATCIQRYAAGHTAETTVSTIDIPSDDIKGRIIGREGRNIRAFERVTGVDVIVDDTPGIVVVSGFDGIRREVAKVALEKLIQDGRIHPSRIEEIVAETQQEMDALILKTGKDAAHEAGIVGLHEKLCHYLGRLKYRTSYSQNVLRHSIEVAFLTGMLAEEIGLNGDLGRRCGLLHDVGKAADHEIEGGHPRVGADLCKRFGEGPEVIHAALGHHDDLRIENPYTVLVAAADAISASRPGARRDTLEKYVRRLEELETLASGFPGVDQVYAIQAGREIRVLVDSKILDDSAATKLSHEIAQAIQQELTYPGEVRVTVLREMRASAIAR